MNRLTIFVLGLCLTTSCLAHAEEWSKNFSIQGKPDLRVETSDANIRVETWDQHLIGARVLADGLKIGEDGLKITDHQTEDSVDLEVRFPHRMGFCIVCIHPGHRVEIVIQMPREGRVNLRTVDGSIRLNRFKGDMELESSDGSQEIEGADGNLRAHAGDGHIRAAGRFDRLDLSTGDGHIEAKVWPGSTMASGWNLRAGDGSVELNLPDNFAADVDLHTGDGHISLDLPVTVEGRLSRSSIHGKLNGGGNLLTVHTGDGSIRLQKS
jgi:Putative adhesin